jgi:hypothetical protein
MVRSVGTVSFVCVLLLFAAQGSAQCLPPPDPRIRAGNPVLVDALATGVKASPTLRSIVSLIESSDVVVYVAFEPPRIAGIAAHVVFISAAGGRRYLHVGIDPRFSGPALVGLLGHELQHAAEIAGEPSVVDRGSLAAFYRRIGFGGSRGTVEHFESERAIDVGYHVERDTSAFIAAEARAVHSSR